MTNSNYIIRNLFSTQDPIKDYERKQDLFVKSMKELKDSDILKDYRVTKSRQDASNNSIDHVERKGS